MGESSNPRFNGEKTLGKMKFSERKRETDLGRKLCKPVIRKQQRRSMAKIKTLVKLTEKNESARAVYPFRPSGWFQRGVPKMQQKTSLTPERILDLAPVGMTFRALPDSESSEI